jgi:hypothetical protein
MRRRITSRAASLAALALTALVVGAPAAQGAPGDYTITYDWQGTPATGFAGIGVRPVPADGTPGFLTPYYRATLGGPQPGITLAPTPAQDGTRDRVYPTTTMEGGESGVRIITELTAPGSTRVRDADFEQITYHRAAAERQFLRFAIYDGADVDYDTRPDARAPGPFLNDQTYSIPSVTVTDPNAAGRSVQTWMFTSCNPVCPTVGFDGATAQPRSTGTLGRLIIHLHDPEPPTVKLTGPATDGAWTKARDPRALQIDTTDRGSGVRRVQLQRNRQGSPPLVTATRDVPCDDLHQRPPTSPRDAAPCPDHDQWPASLALGALPSGTYTLTARATDDSTRVGSALTTVRVDRDRPANVNVGGAIRDLTRTWTNTRSPVTFSADAGDTLSGVATIDLLAVNGGIEVPVGSIAGICGPTDCPARVTGRDRADLSNVPDGRSRLVVRATDRAGNTTTRQLGVIRLDRAVPSQVRVSGDAAGGRSQVRWTAARDTTSGVDHYLVRSRVNNQAWSPARPTTQRTQTRGAIGARGQIAWEITAVDRAGNQGQPTIATLRIHARPCRPARCIPHVTAGALHARGSGLAARTRRQGRRCPVFVKTARVDNVPANPERFQAQNLAPGVRVQIGITRPLAPGVSVQTCNPDDPAIIDAATASYDLHVDNRNGPRVLSNVILRYDGVHPQQNTTETHFACAPESDGNQRIAPNGIGSRRFLLTTAGLRGSVTSTTRDYTAEVPLIPAADQVLLRLQCPSTAKRHDFEIAAWQDLAGYNPLTRNRTTSSRPERSARRILAAAIAPDRPSGPPGAWDAHHIIPLRDTPPDNSDSRLVIPGAFRCHLYPNEAANGTWLRNRAYQYDAEPGSPYRRLDRRERRRQWHPLTQAPFLALYFHRLQQALIRTRAIDPRGGACLNVGRFRAALTGVRQALDTGTFMPASLER